jgi:hypothetical protein
MYLTAAVPSQGDVDPQQRQAPVVADIDLTATQQERDYRAAMDPRGQGQTPPQTRGRTRAAVAEKTQRVRESRREKREGAKAAAAERQAAAEARKIDAKRQRAADKASAAAITKVAPGDMLKMLDQGLKQQKVCVGCPQRMATRWTAASSSMSTSSREDGFTSSESRLNYVYELGTLHRCSRSEEVSSCLGSTPKRGREGPGRAERRAVSD